MTTQCRARAAQQLNGPARMQFGSGHRSGWTLRGGIGGTLPALPALPASAALPVLAVLPALPAPPAPSVPS